MAQQELSSNYDKAGIREWLTFEFWSPADFASNNDLSERTVRHLCTVGMPFHGRPHKGKGGVRLGKSAIRWLLQYRRVTKHSRRFGGINPTFQEDLDLEVADESQAFARLYGLPIPPDKYLDGPEGSEERRSWKKFKAAKPA